MLHVTRDQSSTVFVQCSMSTNLFCKWRFFALSSASWWSREWQLNFVLKPVQVLWKRSNWFKVALPWVVLLCISGMLAFETEGRTWRMMPEVVILRLPEQTKTWNLFFICWTEDRRITLQMIADRLNIGKETVWRIVTEDLGKRKICMRFVSHALTTEQKQERVYC